MENIEPTVKIQISENGNNSAVHISGNKLDVDTHSVNHLDISTEQQSSEEEKSSPHSVHLLHDDQKEVHSLPSDHRDHPEPELVHPFLDPREAGKLVDGLHSRSSSSLHLHPRRHSRFTMLMAKRNVNSYNVYICSF